VKLAGGVVGWQCSWLATRFESVGSAVGWLCSWLAMRLELVGIGWQCSWLVVKLLAVKLIKYGVYSAIAIKLQLKIAVAVVDGELFVESTN
jgi:hypothetical protein